MVRAKSLELKGIHPIQKTSVGFYRRTIRASLSRVWENVLDWEHLPWLHRSSFSDIKLLGEAECVKSKGGQLVYVAG